MLKSPGLALLTGLAAIFIGLAPARADNFVTLQPIDDGDPGTNDLGRANTNINAVPFKRNALTTVGNYQFTSYYRSDGKLLIGRRLTGAATWELFPTEFTSININDGHNTSSIAVDGDGRLHLSWGLHANNLLYTTSIGSAVNSSPIQMTGGTVGNAAALNDMTGLYNGSVTYPEFYNLPDGDLLFAYRNGGSGNGDYRMRRYDTTSAAWTELGAGASDIWIGRQAPGSSLPNVNAYPNELAFDADGNIHATWTWRTGGDTTTGQPGYQTNHHINYARSPDEGATWTNMAGAAYAGPIYETNAEIAVNLPEGSSLINTTGMAIDQLGQPVVATWWAPGAPQGNHVRQYMLAWYDNSQEQWRSSQISHRTIDGPGQTNEGVVRDLGRPIVVVDDANRVIVAYRDNQDANGLTIAFSESPQRNDWQTVDLTVDNAGDWEPIYDVNRWSRDRVLSLLYQPSALGQTGSPMAVLEWDSQAFFADLAAPKLTLVVDRGTGAASIRNGTGAEIAIDGYSIHSPSGALDPAAWMSLADQFPAEWQEANASAAQLNELRPAGATTFDDATVVALGAAYAGAESIGDVTASQDLTFQYVTPEGETRNGPVQYVGYNNLVLYVDPLTGQARLRNSSRFDVAIDGYTISSASGSLQAEDGGWNSLDDQGADGGLWAESNVDEHRVSELLAAGVAPLDGGDQFQLGALFDAAGGEADLVVEFLLHDAATPLTADVVYQIPGDFDLDGTVDGADLAVWRSAFGVSAEGDANGDSETDGGDFLTWQANLGKSWAAPAASGASIVPEPTAGLLAAGALASVARLTRRTSLAPRRTR